MPFSDAERIASETHAELVDVSRLGHNRILYASAVHEYVFAVWKLTSLETRTRRRPLRRFGVTRLFAP